MSRIIHFEIHVDDMDRAIGFYESVFGWTFEDWTGFVGSPYFGAITGSEEEPGINGALCQREGSPVVLNQPFNAFVCTIAVDDYDTIEARILNSGGKCILSKHPLPGMAWQGYYLDTEGNQFGIHQPDENAQ